MIKARRRAVSTASYQATILKDAPLAAYSLMERFPAYQQVRDCSGNGFHASFQTPPPGTGLPGPLREADTAMGGFGSSYASDSRLITLPSGLVVVDSQPVTVEFWYYAGNNTAASSNNAFVFGNPAAAGNRIQAHMPYSGTLYFDCGNFNSSRLNTPWLSAWNNTWAHFCMVARSGASPQLELWVNGTQLATAPRVVGTDSFNGGFIGGWPNTGGVVTPTPAYMAWFAVYQSDLSSTQIATHYTKATKG